MVSTRLLFKKMALAVIACLLLPQGSIGTEERPEVVKPKTFMERLNNYRQKRERALENSVLVTQEQAEIYKKYTKKIGAMLAFTDPRYANCKLRPATQAEASIILNTIIETADLYRDWQNPIKVLYMGQNFEDCKQRMQNDQAYAKHMATITAAHSIRHIHTVNNDLPLPYNQFFNPIKETFTKWSSNSQALSNLDKEIFKKNIKKCTAILNSDDSPYSIFDDVPDIGSIFEYISNDIWDNLDWDYFVPQIGLVPIPSYAKDHGRTQEPDSWTWRGNSNALRKCPIGKIGNSYRYAQTTSLQDNQRSVEEVRMNAQYMYGIMVFNGEGGPKDVGEALKYLKLAADQGHIEAQRMYNLILAQDLSIITR